MKEFSSDVALVTGGSGFIGTKLRALLRSQGMTVVNADLPDNDIRQNGDLVELIADWRPQWIFHLAAQPSIGHSWADPFATWSCNLLGTASLLDAARQAAPSARVLVMSSASVFEANDSGQLIDEDTPLSPRSPYAYSKAATELICRHHVTEYSLPVVIARPFNVIGPGQKETYVVPALADRVVAALASGVRAIEIGEGGSVRDFLDVRDAVEGLRLLAARGSPGRIYNVCSGHGRTVRSVAHRLAGLVGLSIDLRRNADLAGRSGESVLVGDPRRTADEIGWRVATDFDATLRDVLAEASERRAGRLLEDRWS